MISTLCLLAWTVAAPRSIHDRFDLPPGFRIYRAAPAALTGATLDIALDSDERLLVGDGNAVRRLTDQDLDGIFDAQEVIAEGLGSRGPQGMCLDGDRLFAVGGDGIQLFEGYLAGGKLRHVGRIGERFNTGGDHDAHTIFKGHDGFLYFITGDGGGAKDRRHITEENSPCLFERSCSVFRISPDGKRWECVGSGGRNSPNLGMNAMGDLFSFDSDMEWHVELPWWRPIRLHHWMVGGDQGWQDVGAYPPSHIDNLPGIDDVGRGSPDWGVFYEGRQFPERYRDAYLVCDYQTKSATSGNYDASGRLYAFFIERDGAGWKARHEILARPKPNARDLDGQPINFGLVDIEVCPDGSLLLSDHNQGIWRLFFDGDGRFEKEGAPALNLRLRGPLQLDTAESRALLLDGSAVVGARLEVLREMAPQFATLDPALLTALAKDKTWEMRAQAAWLFGLRARRDELETLHALLGDRDAFVRRRAGEALNRAVFAETVEHLLRRLDDPERLVRHAAMTALAHHKTGSWIERAMALESPEAHLRALTAATIRKERPAAAVVVSAMERVLDSLFPSGPLVERLDALRVLSLYQDELQSSESMRKRVHALLVEAFPAKDLDLHREAARLLGQWRVPKGVPKLLEALLAERDPILQFHLAQALARIDSGWSPDDERRAAAWFLSTQRGWFNQFGGKGLQFREFWATVVSQFAERHRDAFLERPDALDLSTVPGQIAIDLLGAPAADPVRLIIFYRAQRAPETRRRILGAIGRVSDRRAEEFLLEEFGRLAEREDRAALIRAIAQRALSQATRPVVIEGLCHPDRDTARAAAERLREAPPALDEALSARLLTHLREHPEQWRFQERLFAAVSERKRPGANERGEEKRLSSSEAQAVWDFWRAWHEGRFGKPFAAAAAPREWDDDPLHALLVSDASRGGDATRGKTIYEAQKCASCHGGLGGAQDRIFGPDLAGVTRRLSRVEVADSLVYPSKLVADRFRAKAILLKEAPPLIGFITEETAEAVVLVDQERVHRIPRSKVAEILTQETSLMPERLLSRLSAQEVRDMMAFLEVLGAQAPATEK